MPIRDREKKLKYMREWGRAHRMDPEFKKKERVRTDAWKKDNPKSVLALLLRTRFGMTLEAYEWILASQGGVCAICRKPPVSRGRRSPARLSVDHDHKTDRIRGLLCGPCNRVLGSVKDSPEVLRQAAEYLEARQ
jgi:hypothetical protein